jgi:hypothetical protein
MSSDDKLECLHCEAEAKDFDLEVHGPKICVLSCMKCHASVTFTENKTVWKFDGKTVELNEA